MSPLATLPLWAQMAVSAAAALVVVSLGGPRAAALLGAWGHRQRIREDAPGRHREKAGTPTMGGLLIVGGIVVAAVAVAGFEARVWFILCAMLGFGAIGFADDLLAIRRGRNLGLRARERLALQGLAGGLLGWAAARLPWASTQVILPGVGPLELGAWGYAVLAGLLFVGFANAVNLTDGLDGLAAGLVALAGVGFAAVAARAGLVSAAVVAGALLAATLGFLRVNTHPARLFMGDVGSNALGATLVGLAVVTKAEVALFVIGGVFVAEAASVLLQVAYFKATGGRRIFRMSPLHHHFELVGWSETRIVRRFYGAGMVCLLAGLLVA